MALRDAARMAEHAAELMATQPELGREPREYLLAAMAGHLATGNNADALELWERHGKHVRTPGSPAFRLLRCLAERKGCEAAFRRYAER